MNFARPEKGRTVLAANDDAADVALIAVWANKLTAKEGARITHMTPNGFKKLQSGENTISYKKLTRWLKADPDFAAAYAAHVGLILPGQAEGAGAFTRAVNAYLRGGT